jgi:O-antigen ligase
MVTGISIIKDNWLTGVGPDAYRYYFMQYRNQVAGSRSWNEVADSAHNYFIDIFSMMGLLTFIGYFTLSSVVFFLSIKAIFKKNITDSSFALSTIWISLFFQTLISPISIPIMLIYFIISGILIGNNFKNYCQLTFDGKFLSTKKNIGLKFISVFLISTLISISIFFNSITKDLKLYSSTKRVDAQEIYNVLLSDPVNSSDFRKFSSIIGRSGNRIMELKILETAVLYNYRDVESWKRIVESPVASDELIRRAYFNWSLLDPNNSKRMPINYYLF